MIITILIFIVILGVLIFVHEFGHFVVARKTGMLTQEFGFGFPPRICGLQKINGKWKIIWGHKPPLDPNRTVYSINWIPLGGFVKILGEDNEHEDDPRSFINRPFWARFATLVAGVSMNFILAWVIISAGFLIGLPTAITSNSDLPHGAKFENAQAGIIEVVFGLPAEKAGMKPGDIVLAIDGQKMENLAGVQNYITENKGKEFNFEIKRDKQILNIKVQSNANPGPDQGPTGIALADIGTLKLPWYTAFIQGAIVTWTQLKAIVVGLSQLITGQVGLSSLGGPVKIAKLTGQVAGMGFVYLLQFAAFLSLNLGVLNILPFPALDGGRVLFLLIEKVRRKRNNQKLEQWVNTAGFVLLILLMLAVTIKDIKG